MKAIKRIGAVALILAVVLTAFTACSIFSPAAKLKGAWRDSTGTMGYEFLDDNLCKITYADVTIPIINIRYDGTVDGSYTVAKTEDGRKTVTVNYTIMSSTISKTYAFSVEGAQLTLTDVEDASNVTILTKYTPATTAAATSAQ